MSLFATLRDLAQRLITGVDARAQRAEREALTRCLAEREAQIARDARTLAMVAALDEAIAVSDERGVVVEWNAAACALFGYEADEVVGNSVGQLLGAEEVPLSELFHGATQPDDRKRVVELLAARKDGTVFQCELSSRRFDAAGKTAYLLVFRDIAERSRAQIALQQSEEKYRALAVHAPVGIMEVDAQGLITFVNRRWTDITGFHWDDAIGKSWAIAVHPDDVARARAVWAESLRNGTPYAVDTRYLKKDRSIAMVHGATVPLKDAYGVTTGYMASMVDFTERHRTLAALAKSESNFRSLVERAPFGVLVVHQGTITYANPTYLEMLGYERVDELAGRSAIETLVHPDDQSRSLAREHERQAGNEVPPATTRALRRDGSVILLEAASTQIEFDGQPSSVFVVRDVTDRERAEQVRLSNERATRESLREKEVLLKEVHHRVKNNLQVIVSLINLQAAKLEDEAIRVAFEETRSRVHAIALLHERLYGAKNLGRIDMRDYLQGLASDLSSTNVDARRIELRVEAQELFFEMDAAMPVGLIVNELVTNAYKHAFPEQGRVGGHIVVALRQLGSELELMVCDDGIGYPHGLDPDDVATLGLMLIASLSRQLEGHVRFENGTQGARCVLRFPNKSALSVAPSASSTSDKVSA